MDLMYSGSIGHVQIKLFNGYLIIVKMALDFKNRPFHVNDNVTSNILPENILVYHEKGLEMELTLE